MAKAVTIAFLFTAIFFAALFSFFYSSLNLLPPENNLNQFFRPKIIRSPTLRQGLNLRQIGDARHALGTASHYPTLKITVFETENFSLSTGVLENAKSEIKKVVKKPEGVTLEIKQIEPPHESSVSDESLKKLAADYPAGKAEVQIFLLGQSESAPSFAGLVTNDHQIYLFMNTIEQVARPGAQPALETSTILHEFAHLLGAEHVDHENCLLSPKIEDTSLGLPNIFRDEYCWYDLAEIRDALN